MRSDLPNRIDRSKQLGVKVILTDHFRQVSAQVEHLDADKGTAGSQIKHNLLTILPLPRDIAGLPLVDDPDVERCGQLAPGRYNRWPSSGTSPAREGTRSRLQLLPATTETSWLEHFLDWLRDTIGVDARAQAFWSTVHELHMVANVIKHGEGWSAQELRKINPRLFDYPGTYGFMAGLHHSPVAAPLAGGDLFVTEEDYVRYVDAVAALWAWLAGQLHGNQWHIPK